MLRELIARRKEESKSSTNFLLNLKFNILFYRYYLYLNGKLAKKELELRTGGVYTVLAEIKEDSVDYVRSF